MIMGHVFIAKLLYFRFFQGTCTVLYDFKSWVPCEDPFAEILAGPKGQVLSDSFGAGSAHFGLPDWPEFHKTWTAVRTRFIDDQIVKVAENKEFKIEQLVNLGAGSLRLSFRFL